jgi:hypothetical protein
LVHTGEGIGMAQSSKKPGAGAASPPAALPNTCRAPGAPVGASPTAGDVLQVIYDRYHEVMDLIRQLPLTERAKLCDVLEPEHS